MDCVLERYSPVLAPCRGAGGGYAGAAYFEGETPVLLREPARGSERPTPGLPDRVLSRQFFACTVTGADAFSVDDTPPFRFSDWVLVSGGDLARAGQTPEHLAIPRHISRSVRGSTGAEQMLHQFVSFLRNAPEPVPNQLMRGYLAALRATLSLDDQWFPNEASRDLTLMLGDGRRVAGATIGRPLWYQHIKGLDTCDACDRGLDGEPSEHPGLRCTVVVDAQARPGRGWQTIEQNHVFSIDRAGDIELMPVS